MLNVKLLVFFRAALLSLPLPLPPLLPHSPCVLQLKQDDGDNDSGAALLCTQLTVPLPRVDVICSFSFCFIIQYCSAKIAVACLSRDKLTALITHRSPVKNASRSFKQGDTSPVKVP